MLLGLLITKIIIILMSLCAALVQKQLQDLAVIYKTTAGEGGVIFIYNTRGMRNKQLPIL